jgi:hypothetical protein
MVLRIKLCAIIHVSTIIRLHVHTGDLDRVIKDDTGNALTLTTLSRAEDFTTCNLRGVRPLNIDLVLSKGVRERLRFVGGSP